MTDHILIRYGELSLKKTNRRQFISRINNHIKRALKEYKDLTFESRGLRFYIMLNGTNFEELIPILKKIPGIHSFSLVSRCASSMEEIKQTTLELVKKELLPNQTFKVETHRADKNFPLTSIEITKEVSRNLFRNIEGLKADVHNPDYILNVEVRLEGTFIFTTSIPGLGGLPAGCLGKAVLMISGGIDSVVAGYMAIRKGISIDALHFAAPPYTSDMAVQKVIDLLEKLTPYTEFQNINLYIVPFTNIQKAIYDNCRDDYGITIMRRMMYRIAERFANEKDCLAIINGENVGQVASQTLESMGTIEEVAKIPVIRPLATLDKEEITLVSQQIDTYEISIRPYEDCCTVFVPKHPQIKPLLSKAIQEENKFDYDTLITEALQNIERIGLRVNRHHSIIPDIKDDIF